MRILFMGDIHSDFYSVNVLLNEQIDNYDIAIQVGDNALFWKGKDRRELVNPPKPLIMINGNHEDYRMIHSIVGRNKKEIVELKNNLFYAPVGSFYKTDTSKIILFLGGAESYDRYSRTEEVDYFRDEVLTNTDYFFVDKNYTKIDCVISHTCPYEFMASSKAMYDPTRHMLSQILKQYKPELWMFGHWHSSKQGVYLGGMGTYQTRWCLLNKIGTVEEEEDSWWRIEEL